MSPSSPERPPWRPSRVVVGRLGRPHGLDGSLYLDGYGGLVPLEPGAAVEVEGRPATVLGRKGDPGRPILRLDLAGDREAAAALRGRELSVDAGLLPERDPDEYLHVDLLGCRVVAGERTLGAVRDVLVYPANDVLEVTGEGAAVLIPFVADVVLEVDVPGRTIQVRDDFLP